jgi:sirohydrochlorin ferrochelatase
MRTVVLLDNGSSRAESTLSLRRLASALAERVGEQVHPVSLLHASRVPAGDLGGRPADTLEPFLRRRVAEGARDFLILPLFFGRSGALTGFIPDKAAAVRRDLGPFALRLADVLCPLPEGEPRLARILADNVRRVARDRGLDSRRVVLVDHGSPLPEVNQVRRVLAAHLREDFGSRTALDEAVMERRAGSEYDFNGELLADALRGLALADREGPVILSMLFLSPGRHAGTGGDIEEIRTRAEQEFPGFRVFPTSLVGAHPGLVDILESRYRRAVQAV